MIAKRCLMLLLTLCLTAPSLAGDIQVFCEPGLNVYLDRALAGVSSVRDDGFYLLDVARGKHTIKVEKNGFVAQSFEIDLRDQPIEIELQAFVPLSAEKEQQEEQAESPSAQPRQQAGSLVVTSAPQRCLVEVDGKPQEKNTPQLSIGGLSAGAHTISFSKPGYEAISEVIDIPSGVAVTIRGNLKAGKIELAHNGKGSLRVISTPKRCTVLFRGKRREKTSMKLNLSRIPAGEYPIVVSYGGREHAATILIKDGQRTIVRVNFMRGAEAIAVSYLPE